MQPGSHVSVLSVVKHTPVHAHTRTHAGLSPPKRSGTMSIGIVDAQILGRTFYLCARCHDMRCGVKATKKLSEDKKQ